MTEWSRSAAVARLRTVVTVARERELTFLAAALAYYGLVSLVPALLLVSVAAATLAGEAAAARLTTALGSFLSPAGRDVVAETVGDPAGRGGAGVAGLVALLWGTLKLFRGLDAAFSRLYGTAGSESFAASLRDATVVSTSTVLGFSTTVAVGAVTAGLGGLAARLVGPPASVAALTLVFLPAYVVFPDAQVRPREALPGAVVVATGWTLLQVGFAVYARTVGGSLAGVLGGVVLLVTWFYAAAALVLLGAVVNAVLADRVTPS